VQDVDLIIRTGGEQRLSDFLLWEGAYAELYFTGVMWPDFGRRELQAAIAEFHGRERRFGSVPAVATAAAGSLPPTPAVAAGSGPAAAPAVAAGV
jgi:undecaprenyl diphosphate synthase